MMHKFLYSMAALNFTAVMINLPFLDHPFNAAMAALNVPLCAMNYFFAKDAKKTMDEWG